MKRTNVISPVGFDVRKFQDCTASSVVARSRYLPSFAKQNSMSKPDRAEPIGELRKATEYVIFAEIYRKIGILRGNKNVASFCEANAGS